MKIHHVWHKVLFYLLKASPLLGIDDNKTEYSYLARGNGMAFIYNLVNLITSQSTSVM